MYTYKIKDFQEGDSELTIIGVGQTVDGVIKSNWPIENPRLECTEKPQDKNEASPAHLNGVVGQDQQPVIKIESEQE